MSKTVKLHGILATKKELQAQANSALADLKKTFTEKSSRFTGFLHTFTPNKPEVEGGDIETKTEKELVVQTTAFKELAWIKPFLTRAIDTHYHVAVGNTTAFANIELEDGTVLAQAVPASTLLELETYLQQTVKPLLLAIPTLDPVQGFEPDLTYAISGVFKSRTRESIRSNKKKEVLTLKQTSDKHPDNFQVYDVDVPVGTIRQQDWSGMLTPAQKSDVLSRLEDVIRAVKKARSSANEVDVDVDRKIGGSLLTHIFGV